MQVLLFHAHSPFYTKTLKFRSSAADPQRLHKTSQAMDCSLSSSQPLCAVDELKFITHTPSRRSRRVRRGRRRQTVPLELSLNNEDKRSGNGGSDSTSISSCYIELTRPKVSELHINAIADDLLRLVDLAMKQDDNSTTHADDRAGV